MKAVDLLEGTEYDLQNVFSNSELETVYRNKGFYAFGKVKRITESLLNKIREEINRRNREGVYIFANRSERKRLTFRRNLLPAIVKTNKAEYVLN
jgi:hypothetical protein